MEEKSMVLQSMKAWMWFFIGYFFIAIVPWIFPTLSELIDNSNYAGVVEISVIIIEILFIIVLPLYHGTKHFYTEQAIHEPVKESVISIIILIFGLLITYFGYFMVTNNGGEGGMVSLLETTFEITLFWIGLIITWLTTIVIAPITNIIKTTRN